MATAAVLRSQDCVLRPSRFPSEATLSSSLFKPHGNPNPNPQSARSRRRKGSPVGSAVTRFPAKNLVMGEVKILKRGEEIPKSQSPPPPEAKKSNRRFCGENLVVCSTDRLGPDPEIVQKQVRVSDSKVVDGLYAGSATFLASPPPSSLPVPDFFMKKKNNDAATSDLRRLLNLL
ncbi:Cortactin-binding protein like [Actinidia chinensis var. chinensis]|uniref:Cortactin-binding protein like n=1 Tax=Actinidia chinensis var. chinensis TaxID=1590841 RepID=A0A2R6R4S0_ACTCC|nr:Cortactin-binding protein like [Actinidia chinensis var. chinensis]